MSVLNKFIKFAPIASHIRKNIRRFSSETSTAFRVTVCGAGGNVGQPLCLMLKQSPLIEELAIFDSIGIKGFGAELAYVDTTCKVSTYSGADHLSEALLGAQIVVILASSKRAPNAAFSSMFEANACIVKEIIENMALHAPTALVAIATNPVNSLVPLACEVLQENGSFDPNKVFGITAANVVRANTFVAKIQGLKPESVVVPVIGGHSDKTIIPLLSQAKPCADMTAEEIEKITEKVQKAHHFITDAKVVNHGPNLCCAFAITRFVLSLIKGLLGDNNVIECAYVKSKAHPHSRYLATPLLLGKKGIEKNFGIPPEISEYEKCQLDYAVPLIMNDVKRGERFTGVVNPPPCDPCDPNPKSDPCPPKWCQMI